MPAAFTVVQCVSFDPLYTRDGIIVQANVPAAHLYGYDRPEELTGQWLSMVQTPEARLRGKLSWGLRQLGYQVPDEYCTLVEWPDGTVAGQRGELISQMRNLQGEVVYLTRLEGIMQLEEPTLPEPDLYGVTPEAIDEVTGLFTVRELRDHVHNGTLPLKCRENFTTIVSECEWTATHILNWPVGSGIFLALRPDLCTWSLNATDTPPVVYFHTQCPRCLRQWWRRSSRQLTWQCPAPGCKAHLP